MTFKIVRFPQIKTILLVMLFSFFSNTKIIAQENATEQETIYSNPGTYPSFEGGMVKFHKFFAKNFKAPNRYKGVGNLGLSFVIEKDGSLTDIKVVKDPGNGTGAEALRVMKLSPKWIPGKDNGKVVRTLFYLPIKVGYN